MQTIERIYGNIQQKETFDELNRKRICEFKSLKKEDNFSGQQIFEYDEMGNILKRSILYNQNGTSEARKCYFDYDEKGRIISYKELIDQDNTQTVVLNRVFRYEIVKDEWCLKDGHTDSKRYFIYCREFVQEEKKRTFREKLVFKVVVNGLQNGYQQLYYLPEGILSFQKVYDVKEKGIVQYLSPVGGKYRWILEDINNDSATICLYETVLTLEIYQEIVQYCKKISPNLSFISFSPECFVEPSKEVDRIMNWIKKIDVWYGIY